MNFLAHAYLSGNEDEWLAGNLFTDFVKGNGKGIFPPNVYRGILLHREIDRFTDEHQAVKDSRKILFPHIRHYAMVIVDVLMDHFLGKHWNTFYTQPLISFSQQVYKRLEIFRPIFPGNFEWVFQRMRAHDWLSSYADREYLFDSFYGLAKRSPGFTQAGKTAEVITLHYAELENYFLAFFPQIVSHIETYRKKLPLLS